MIKQSWQEPTPSTAYLSLVDFITFATPRLSRGEMLECVDVLLDGVRQFDLAETLGAQPIDMPALRSA